MGVHPGQDFAAWLTARRYSPKTIDAYTHYARRLDVFTSPARCDLAELVDFVQTLPQSGPSQAMARKALIVYLRFVGRDPNPAERLPTIPAADGLPRPLAPDEYRAWIASAHALGGLHQLIRFSAHPTKSGNDESPRPRHEAERRGQCRGGSVEFGEWIRSVQVDDQIQQVVVGERRIVPLWARGQRDPMGADPGIDQLHDVPFRGFADDPPFASWAGEQVDGASRVDREEDVAAGDVDGSAPVAGGPYPRDRHSTSMVRTTRPPRLQTSMRRTSGRFSFTPRTASRRRVYPSEASMTSPFPARIE